jgi:hypothetical protein
LRDPRELLEATSGTATVAGAVAACLLKRPPRWARRAAVIDWLLLAARSAATENPRRTR